MQNDAPTFCEPQQPLFRKTDYFVADLDFKIAQRFVARYHYARGGSNTFVYLHGLYERATRRLPDGTVLIAPCVGLVWWLPPTRVACESVNRAKWKQVLSLTRMVILPGVPKNACSFLLARSVKLIKQDGRFVSLVTYADESQGHTGGVYRAANWKYVGRTGPYPRWHDVSGKQVAQKSTTNRTKEAMEALGHTKIGTFFKHKFVLHLEN